jgi:hypothetical protein
VKVTLTDGRSGSTLELHRTAPIISSDDRRALADGIAAQLQRPIASVDLITPLTRPNSNTGELEPDVPAGIPTAAPDDPQPWHYQVHYVTDGGRGTCELNRMEPILGRPELDATAASITAEYGRRVVAIESFRTLAAPASPSRRGL